MNAAFSWDSTYQSEATPSNCLFQQLEAFRQMHSHVDSVDADSPDGQTIAYATLAGKEESIRVEQNP